MRWEWCNFVDVDVEYASSSLSFCIIKTLDVKSVHVVVAFNSKITLYVLRVKYKILSAVPRNLRIYTSLSSPEQN